MQDRREMALSSRPNDMLIPMVPTRYLRRRRPCGSRRGVAEHIDNSIYCRRDAGAVSSRRCGARGLTEVELARRAGTSPPVVSAYEHGRRDPTFRTLSKLLEAGGERLIIDTRPRTGRVAEHQSRGTRPSAWSTQPTDRTFSVKQRRPMWPRIAGEPTLAIDSKFPV